MKIKYEKPIKEIYDGYETEEVIKAIFNVYYSEYDYETFKMVFIDDDEIKKELYERRFNYA